MTGRRPLTEATAGAELVALMYGTAHRSTSVLLSNLARHETETGWRRDILAAGSPWRAMLEVAVAGAEDSDIVAGLAQRPEQVEGAGLRGIGAADEDEAVTAARRAFRFDGIGASEARNVREDFLQRISDVRAVARKYPSSARVHLVVGALMGWAARRLGAAELRNEAVIECRIAAEILPGWDAPLVEPAILLVNEGRFEAALAELDSAEKKLPQPTPHLRWARGCALMGLKRYRHALHEFEQVLEAKPDYAAALARAAECAFKIGDRSAGIKLAKKAFLLGEQQPYLAWWAKVHTSTVAL